MHINDKKLWLDGIDAFLFDLGRVLLDFSHEEMLEQIAGVTGITTAVLRDLLFSERLLHRLERGAISDDGFIAELASIANVSCDAPSIRHAMSDIFTPILGMVNLLPHLQACGKRLVLVSNTSSIHFEHALVRYPWLRLFDAHVLSYQIGCMKPAADFYSAAVDAAQVSPERCLFIDDLAENIAGANKAGFQTHHFTDRDAFLKKFPWH